jgi:hypothetical protein
MIHVYTPEQIMRVFEAIPAHFPNVADQVETFLLVQQYSALRMSDMVTLEVASLQDEGFTKEAQVKTGRPVFCQLPPWVVMKLRAITPRSQRYFF